LTTVLVSVVHVSFAIGWLGSETFFRFIAEFVPLAAAPVVVERTLGDVEKSLGDGDEYETLDELEERGCKGVGGGGMET